MSLPLFVEKLKSEEDEVRIKFIRISRGDTLLRQSKYIELENRLYNFVSSNQDENFGIGFIFRLLNHVFY